MTRTIASRFIGSFSRASRVSFMGYLDLYRQRRTLASLDDNMLKDLGITRYQAMVEADRPIWDTPENWNC
jgi:uncharacterized protein YjiS (DUF1127 family)